MAPGKMRLQGLTSHLFYIALILTVCRNDISYGHTQERLNCGLSVPNNATQFDRLAKYFHRDSQIIILEYNITFNTVGSKFNLLNQSRSEAFEPWIWYRTQGPHSSFCLRSYEKYLGTLGVLLYFGVEKESIQLDVSPPECLDGLRGNALEGVIRKFLLKDFNIDGNSWKHSFTYSEDIEICTASIADEKGFAKLVYRCCRLTSENIMSCQEISANAWVRILNITLIVWAVILVICLPWIIARINNLYGDESYTYRIPKGSQLKFDFILRKDSKAAEMENKKEYGNIIKLDKMKWEKMESLKSTLEEIERDQFMTASVRTLNIRVARHKLFNKYEKTHSVKRFFHWLINCEPNDSTGKVACVVTRRLACMMIVFLLNVPLLLAHFKTDSLFTKLMKSYKERGLRGSFQFHWAHTVLIQRDLLIYLYSIFAGYVIYFVIFLPIFQSLCRDKVVGINNYFSKILSGLKWKNFFKEHFFIILNVTLPFVFCILTTLKTAKGSPVNKCCLNANIIIVGFAFLITSSPLMLTLIIGINFFLHFLVMIIFTIIVEVGIFSGVLKILVLILALIQEFFHDLGENNGQLKETLLDMCKDSCANWGDENTIHEITKIDGYNSTNCHDDKTESGTCEASQMGAVLTDPKTCDSPNDGAQESSKKNATRHLEKNESGLVLRTEHPCLFLSEHDIPSVSRKLLFHFTSIDCVGGPREWNVVKTLSTYLVFALFVGTVYMVVPAYGHNHHITRGVFATFAASFVALVIKRLCINAKHATAIDKDNRRFLDRIKAKLSRFSGHLRVSDFKDMDIWRSHDAMNETLVVFDDKPTESKPQSNDNESETDYYLKIQDHPVNKEADKSAYENWNLKKERKKGEKRYQC